jgi:hypothetical protein
MSSPRLEPGYLGALFLPLLPLVAQEVLRLRSNHPRLAPMQERPPTEWSSLVVIGHRGLPFDGPSTGPGKLAR